MRHMNYSRWITLILIPVVAGCAKPLDTTRAWGPRTRQFDAIFRVDGRDDRKLVYRDNDRTDAPLTLLFLHGIGSSKVAWKSVAPRFADQCRVISLDLLGHGDSDKPVEFGYLMSQQADLVRKFIAQLGLHDLVIVGHSYGGGVALETALAYLDSRNPDANVAGDGYSKILRGLVLLDPSALYFEKPGILELTKGTDVSLIEALLSSDSRARLLLEVAFKHNKNIPQDLYAEYARVFRDPRTTDVYLWIANHELFKELSARKGDDSRYRAITCPTLVLWGDSDRVVPREVFDRLCAVLPNATCALVSDCGHTPAEERPGETVVQIQRFLNNRIQPAIGPTIVLSPEIPDLPVLTNVP